MSTVVDWVHSMRVDRATQIFAAHPTATRAAAVLAGVAATPDREQGSVWSAVAGALAAFDLDTVVASADAAAFSDFDSSAFLEGDNALFVVAPSDLSVSLAPLVVGLIEEIRTAALHLSEEQGGSLHRPLLLALDEIANISPLPSLPQIASEGGGRNILLLAAIQDLSQAAERWGRDVAAGLLSLAGAKLVLPGVGDTDTLQRLEALCGRQWVAQMSRTDTRGPGFLSGNWNTSTHHGFVEQPVFPVAAIRELEPGTALAIVGSRPPEICRLATYHRARPFSTWAAMPAHSSSQAGTSTPV